MREAVLGTVGIELRRRIHSFWGASETLAGGEFRGVRSRMYAFNGGDREGGGRDGRSGREVGCLNGRRPLLLA